VSLSNNINEERFFMPLKMAYLVADSVIPSKPSKVQMLHKYLLILITMFFSL